MGSLGLSADECNSMLDALRMELSTVEDNLLQEIAGNHVLGSLVDLDFVEYVDILSEPGDRMILRINGSITDAPQHIRDQLEALEGSGTSLQAVGSALLIVKRCPSMRQLSDLVTPLGEKLHRGARFGWGDFIDKRLGDELDILIVLCGIGKSTNELDALAASWQAQTHGYAIRDSQELMDIPSFLRPKC